MQSYLHWLIHTFNKAINFRTSSGTPNKFGIQCPRKRLRNFANKARLSVKNSYLWITIKLTTMVNNKIVVIALSALTPYETNENMSSLSNGKKTNVK